jgi:collagenase-like PrtC family protease
MPKRTKEQLRDEIRDLASIIEECMSFAFTGGFDAVYIGMAKRRAQELAVECQRLEDLENEGIEEAVQHLRKGLEDE